MQYEQLYEIEQKFMAYSQSFLCGDKFIDEHIQLKIDHSLNVRDESKYIAEHIGLDRGQTNMALAIGVLHDIGRFEQFAKYKTYCDKRSLNHSQLGVEILNRLDILNDISNDQKQFIVKAVRNHGLKYLPPDLVGIEKIYCQIVRDADKIDIYPVVLNIYRQQRDKPHDFGYEVEYEYTDQCSDQVIELLMAGQTVDYHLVKTMTENRLLQLAWIYDLNFTSSLERLVSKGHIDELISFLPTQDQRIKKVIEKVKADISTRLAH